jgi:hypothetical protein
MGGATLASEAPTPERLSGFNMMLTMSEAKTERRGCGPASPQRQDEAMKSVMQRLFDSEIETLRLFPNGVFAK